MTVILVVDDSAADRTLAAGIIGREPAYEVQHASSAEEALDVLRNHTVDAVVTDLQMPGMNGLDLVRTIREEFPAIPAVLMTAKGSEEIAVEALQSGASSYVPKRVLTTDLLDTVRSVLAASQRERADERLLQYSDGDELEFVLENDLELISSMVAFLKESMQATGLCEPADEIRIGTALDEALLNAYYHGNLDVSSDLRESDHQEYYDLARERTQQSPYKERRIHVRAFFSPEEARFVIRDEGQGFDPDSLPDPTDPENLDRPCGRGLLLMRTFMDELVYNDTGNEVRMVKRRKSDAEAA